MRKSVLIPIVRSVDGRWIQRFALEDLVDEGRTPYRQLRLRHSGGVPKLGDVTFARMALAALATAALSFGLDSASASAAMQDPPYDDCSQAAADGRYSIPYTDPAYRPELDVNGDGLACEPSKAHRSRR